MEGAVIQAPEAEHFMVQNPKTYFASRLNRSFRK